MQFLKALYAFYQTLLSHECEHTRVTSTPGQPAKAGYCPDCGYKVAMVWTLCRCRTCGSKRHPKKQIDGRVSTLYKFCQHCGESDFQIIKKEKINIHEMPYALLTKEIDYAEERIPSPKRAANPFELPRLDIVEGEVVRKREFIGSTQQI